MEFDDRDWSRREWIKINEIFHVFLVENTLHWTQRTRQQLLPGCDKLPSPSTASSSSSSASGAGSLQLQQEQEEKFYWPALVSMT